MRTIAGVDFCGGNADYWTRNEDLNISWCFPRAIFDDGYRQICPSWKALRVAVDQARSWIAHVAFLDNTVAQCAASVGARDTVIDKNEFGSMPKAAPGESQIGTHIYLHRFSGAWSGRRELFSMKWGRQAKQ